MQPSLARGTIYLQVAVKRSCSPFLLPEQSPHSVQGLPPHSYSLEKRTMHSRSSMHSFLLWLAIAPFILITCQAYETDDTFDYDLASIDDGQASCANIINTCYGGFLASTDCVYDYCVAQCADPDDCCHSEEIMSCFSNSSAFASCTSIADGISSCASATPGFTTLPIASQVSCFCSDRNGTYTGYLWDNAATTCFAAMSTQTTWSTSELDDSSYSYYYVGACTGFEDTPTLSSTGTSSGGISGTATPAASLSSSGSKTTTGTSGTLSGATAGTLPSTTNTPTATATTASITSGGNKKGLEGCGMGFGAFLIIWWLFASL